MMKWQGFFLSDHQAALRQQRRLHHYLRLPKQSLQQVSQQLMHAWRSQKVVLVQLNAVQDDQQLVTWSGTVEGVNGPDILLNTSELQLKRIPINEIRAVCQKSSDLDQFY